MRITILRGISGSGKSYWANQRRDQAVIVSADAYFFDANGEYRFDIEQLAEHHRQCFRDFLRAVTEQTPWIIVDNTNISAWEFSPYVLAGESYGYEVQILSFPCTLALSVSRKDWVPPEQVARSLERFANETSHLPAKFRPIHQLMPVYSN